MKNFNKNFSNILGGIFVFSIILGLIGGGIKAIFGGEVEGTVKTDDCRQVIQISPDSFQTIYKKFTCTYSRTNSGVVNFARCDHIDSPLFSNSCNTDYYYIREKGLGNCTDPKYPYLGQDDKCYPTDCTNPPNVYKWSDGTCETTPEGSIVSSPTPTPSTCLQLTQDAAEQEVKNLPQVQDFLKRMQAAGQPTVIIPDSSKTDSNGILIWTIHVAEDHTDHLATFNWYYVNGCTGDITDFNGVKYSQK